MSNILSDELKKVVLAGIGAVASTAEKSKELIDELVKKGELTIDQGKVLNEELKHNIKSVIKDNVPSKSRSEKSIIDELDKLSPEELSELKEKLAAMEESDTDNADYAEEE